MDYKREEESKRDRKEKEMKYPSIYCYDVDDLKSKGGVCWHYSRYYTDWADDIGFYSSEVTVDINDTTRHRFAVISNDEGYCLLDQNTIKCQGLML